MNHDMNIQDLVSLGLYRDALLILNEESNESTRGTRLHCYERSHEAIFRLPFFLRLLHALQPLAQIPQISSSKSEGKTITTEESTIDEIVSLLEKVAVSYPAAEGIDLLTSYLSPKICQPISKCPPLVRRKNYFVKVLNKDLHSSDSVIVKHGLIAEESYTTPAWYTDNLKRALTLESKHDGNYVSGDEKRLRISANDGDYYNNKDEITQENILSNPEEIYRSSQDDDKLIDEEFESQPIFPATSKSTLIRKRKLRQNSEHEIESSAPDGDEQESSVGKTLMEVVDLVVSSLHSIEIGNDSKFSRDNNKTSADTENYGNLDDTEDSKKSYINSEIEKKDIGPSNKDILSQNGQESAGNVFIHVKPESLLAEPRPTIINDDETNIFDDENDVAAITYTTTDDLFTSGGAGHDLSATISSLMHHIPAIRHDHLANALCRAALPQAPTIIVRLAANCPSSSRALVRGCIDAVLATSTRAQNNAEVESHRKIQDVVKQSIVSLAHLSARDMSHAVTLLKQSGVMPATLFNLMIIHDPIHAILFLFEDLSLCLLEKIHKNKDECIASCNSERANSYIHNGSKFIRRSLRHRGALTSMNKIPIRISAVLANDKDLASKARKLIGDYLQNFVDKCQETAAFCGEVVLMLKTYCLLIYHVQIGAGSYPGSGSIFVEQFMNSLRLLVHHRLYRYEGGDIPQTSCYDDLIKMSICSCIVTCVNFAPISDANHSFISSPPCVACTTTLSYLLRSNISKSSKSFISILSDTIHGLKASEIMHIVLYTVLGTDERHNYCVSDEELNRFSNFCRWVISKQSNIPHIKYGFNLSSIDVHLFEGFDVGLIDCVPTDSLDEIMSQALTSPDTCSALYCNRHWPTFVKNMVKNTVKKPEPLIPSVLPLALAQLALEAFPLNDIQDQSLSNYKRQFIVLFLYAMYFLHEVPTSPFVIEPRSFPICDTLSFIKEEIREENNSLLYEEFLKLFSIYAPDMLDIADDNKCLLSFHGSSVPKKVLCASPETIFDAIRIYVIEPPTHDKEGYHLLQLYLISKAYIPFCRLIEKISQSLFSSIFGATPYLSYAGLCKDPLIIFKLPVKVWKCAGIRLIIISIFRQLLKANDFMIKIQSKKYEVATDILSSRDVIICRCLILISSGELGPPIQCSYVILFLRQLISTKKGLTATLLRQGLSNNAVDWLVEFVPECLDDIEAFIHILENRALSVMERLRTADATLRIALANSSRNEYGATTLMNSSLSVLSSSLHLAFGPVGLPLNSTYEKNSGEDITLLVRNHTFRMFGALEKIHNKPCDMKNEVRQTLIKIASFCKNESSSSSLTGIAANKRKAIIFEIINATMKSASTVGGVQI